MRRRVLLKSGLAGASLGAIGSVWAQSYPNRPVKIVVPFAAGGPGDLFARFAAQKLQDALGQVFLIDNRPGGGSVIGTDVAAKAAPDGYTLLQVSNTHTANETLIPNKSFALMRDFVAVTPINYSDQVLVAHPSTGFQTVADLVAKARAQPGKINYASSGPGTPYHMAGELFKFMANVNMVHVPYKGSSGARTDVIGGQVDLMFDAVTTMAEHVRTGKVRALATTGKTRSSVLPDVPTVHEAGVPNYEAVVWVGLMAPRGTPKEEIDRINGIVNQAMQQTELRQQWGRQGAVPMLMSAAEFDKFLTDDIQKWGAVIKSAQIKVD
ncbi:MAG: tripartite tricarboxylate transporter substrate binding protein [Alphaproteobacteria bacterium]|nr:tripartite tricarboxylate transporter substrate binding protein [Alphaproteobacteria bacterium]